MYFQIISVVPKSMFQDLPEIVQFALDDYIDDQLCMYRTTNSFIDGYMQAREYNPLIKRLSARKKESLKELRSLANTHCEAINISERIAKVMKFILTERKSLSC